MLPSFDHLGPRRIVFGAGSRRRLPALLGGVRRLLVATGRRDEPFHELQQLLPGVELHRWIIGGEPTIEDAREGSQRACGLMVDGVLAIGGGSVLDAGKSAAALCTNPKDVLHYLEVIGEGQPLAFDPLPFFALPTTSGTGSEATKNTVLGSPSHGVKASLRSDRMWPTLALVDPELTIDCPHSVTAASGLDAITQLVEPFLSPAATPFTDALVRDALPRALRALPRVLADPHDLSARTDMAYAALCSGLCLANAKLGVVHGIAGPLGGRRPISHGDICARLLPVALSFNLASLRGPRAEELCAMLAGQALVELAGIPGFATGGLTESDLAPLAEQALKSGSTKANPVPVNATDIMNLLKASL
jgi:alcohol dehydrogenase class IV